MQDFNQTFAYVQALTFSDPAIVQMDWRAIHDKRKDVPAIPFRGTLHDCWNSIVHYNNLGYGIFVTVNEMDGAGLYVHNVSRIRAHFVDLDNLSAEQNLAAAAAWYPTPSFAVQSSTGKAHVYWPVNPYNDHDKFSLIQRKLIAKFDSDPSIIDPPRVMRVPGTLHLKNDPKLVTCWPLSGYGYSSDVSLFESALSDVVAIEGGGGGRHELGDDALRAPSLEWLQYALDHIDPNSLDRGEWISVTAAFKQAAWLLGTEETIYNMWCKWCEKYEQNDVGENVKQWNSIRSTEVGWKSFERRVPIIKAYMKLGPNGNAVAAQAPANPAQPMPTTTIPPMPSPSQIISGEIIDENEQKIWFDKCVFVSRFGEILTPSGRMMNATKFNGEYGGKKFLIDSNGKVTNEPWQAALRSTLWTIPKADHLRFVPERKPRELIEDELGRMGVNTYMPIKVKSRPGDITPFLNHMALMLPVESDREIIFKFLAHNAKFPGFKIPWAFVIQSVPGTGKGMVLKALLRHVMGGPYIHFPNAKEMQESGSKFNAWMRGKLFILVDEIKVDERRDMIEILKPMITEEEIEIQSKGHDQDKEDNYSNWAFFTNYKDAVPIDQNDRRFSIFYSALQSKEDLHARGMNDDYFKWLKSWLDNGGVEHIAHWLLNYPIERGEIPMTAPDTSSTAEVLHQSRSPYEAALLEAIEDGLPGFCGGYVGLIAATNRLKASGFRQPSTKAVATMLEKFGYVPIGKAIRPYFKEDPVSRSQIFARDRNASVAGYGVAQGWE